MPRPRFSSTTLVLLASLATSAIAQDQVPASVSGTVMNASTNAPFPGVLVMMAGGGVATTDDSGRFTLKDVRPGTWRIQALKTGTAPPARDSAPRVLTIRPGEGIRDIRLWLSPLATLRGRITDPDGNPLKAVRVEALVVAYQAGNRILGAPDTPVGGSVGTRTGEEGEYELELSPGKYYIAANFTEPGQPEVSTSFGTLLNGNTVRTYYAGTLNSELAATVTVSGGDTVYADFKAFLKGQQLSRISGKIVGARTRPVRPGTGSPIRTFRLVQRNTPGYSSPALFLPDFRYGQMTMPEDFEIVGVAAGSYDLIIDDEMADGRRGRGMIPIDVKGRDIENLVVVLHPGQDIEGKVVVRGVSNAIPLEQIAIRGGPPPVMAGADGKFTLPDVSEGTHPIRADGLPPDGYVADIRQGTVSLFDSARTLAGPQYAVSDGYSVPLEVIVSPNGGVIRGAVEGPANHNVAGATVVLVPGPTRQFVQTYYRSAVVGSTGDFTFQGLAPGVYRLYAWESIPNTAWLNPEFIASYEGRGESVSVESGKRQDVRVRLIARED
jgi:Carboxypeptidase regulatory-like domain